MIIPILYLEKILVKPTRAIHTMAKISRDRERKAKKQKMKLKYKYKQI
jgi:hypothetical protein